MKSHFNYSLLSFFVFILSFSGMASGDLLKCTPHSFTDLSHNEDWVENLALNARMIEAGDVSDFPPVSGILFAATNLEATNKIYAIAALRFSSEDCVRSRVVVQGELLNEEKMIELLREKPDALILFNLTEESIRANPGLLGLLKRVLDNRCAVQGCASVSRDASLFLLYTNLSRELFLKIPTASDVVARLTLRDSNLQ